MKKISLKTPLRFKGRYTIKVFKAGTQELLRQSTHENLIVLNTNNGLHIILQHLAGITTFPLELTTAEIGTGSTAPVDGNTALQTPVVTGISRSTVTVGADFVDTEWFFTDGELPNGTYNEFGLRCGAKLFCRSIISPAHTKATGEDTLFEYTISCDNVL